MGDSVSLPKVIAEKPSNVNATWELADESLRAIERSGWLNITFPLPSILSLGERKNIQDAGVSNKRFRVCYPFP